MAKLTNLTELNLYSNQIKSIPNSLIQLANLIELRLSNNKIKVGKEVFELPPQEQIAAILKWQAAEKANQLQPIHEAKVIFIGQSNYGKTHLIELLKEGKIKRKITTTHGIERSRIEIDHPIKPIRVNLWDLGGQEFMRSTHQFFFSERTLYVLVTLARTERNELNHWLKLANQLGNNAPVLVVINKIDQNPHDLDHNSLQRDYPNIIGFVRTTINDCNETTSKASIDQLQQQISAIISNKEKMPSVFERRRPEWFLVKEELEKLDAKGKNYISYVEYENLEHIKDLPEEERKSNLKLLSILGTIVSYANDPRLIDTNVINPQWVMDGVYAIINDSIIKDDNKGKLHINDLARVLDKTKFPKDKHAFLLELLQKFNLCYQAKNSRNIFFIPDLFEDIEPDIKWENKDVMHFRYNYDDFPPDAFMTRFIVEMHEDIIGKKRWRSGVYIDNGNCKAKVYQGYRRNTINVEIIGNPRHQRQYLYAIREVFRRLHKPFPEMKIMEEVNYKDHWISYKKLEKHEERNREFYHDELDEDLPVRKILNGYKSSGNLIEKAKMLLGQGKIKEAFVSLEKMQSSEYKYEESELILLQSRYRNLEAKMHNGLMKEDDYRIPFNNIVNDLLAFLEEI